MSCARPENRIFPARRTAAGKCSRILLTRSGQVETIPPHFMTFRKRTGTVLRTAGTKVSGRARNSRYSVNTKKGARLSPTGRKSLPGPLSHTTSPTAFRRNARNHAQQRPRYFVLIQEHTAFYRGRIHGIHFEADSHPRHRKTATKRTKTELGNAPKRAVRTGKPTREGSRP